VKRNEQLILGAVALVALIAGFWLLVLSPKRHQASELQGDVDQLHASLAQAQQDIAAGQEAQKSFGLSYRRMVVLGKAVPADSEQTSLLVQLQGLATRSGVDFQSIDLGDASSAASAAPAPSTSTSTSTTDSSSTTSATDTSASSDGTATSSTASTPTDTTASATATEASVATLPIGAAAGPAGLPVMPYDMTFTGSFFQIADFMQRLDGLVHVRKGTADVRGRLLTVNSFTLGPAGDGSTSGGTLTADLSVTTFLTPPDQGTTAGATPSGPAAATPALTSTSTTAPSSSTEATTSTTTP
jgi:Tfp pilus assembly protein PilO